MSQLIDSAAATQLERMPPHSIEAEMCLLASMMLEKETVGQVLPLIERDAFFQPDHQIIYEVILKLFEQNRPVTAMMVREELLKRQLLEETGGAPYLAAILNSVPDASHATHYAQIVREKFMLRQIIAAGNDILRDAYGPHEQADLVLDKAEKRVFQIAEKKVGQAMVHIHDAMGEAYEAILHKGPRGIETGYFDLDEILNGLQNGEMIVIAARPSMGKTALAMNIIEHIAADNQQPCAIFSMEMSKLQLAQRMLCSRGCIDGQKLRRGMLGEQEQQNLLALVGQMAKVPIWVDDSPTLTPLESRAKARRLKRQHDVKCIVIDYLQLMDNPGPENRVQQITEISRAIKATARELAIPVIALSQLNRQNESRDGHRPRMSDLRDSGSIEQDADVVILLHREDYYKMSEPDFVPDNIAELIVAKQRNGPTGTVKLAFMNRTTRFENLSAQTEPF
jgi:replicative DNA helicase